MIENKKMNKVTYVPAYFIPTGKEKTVKIPTGEKTKGLFGEKDITRKEKVFQQTGWSDTQIDAKRLAEDLDKAISELNANGYEIISVTPIISGKYQFEKDYKKGEVGFTESKGGWGYGWGYGYGYSYTDSLIVVAKKIV